MQLRAAEKRTLAADLAASGDHVRARYELAEAEHLAQDVTDILDPFLHTTAQVQIGRGGEVATKTAMMRPYVDTVRRNPDWFVHDTSRARIELAAGAGVLTTAVVAAETIQARNSLEKMMAQKLAALHMLAMKSAATAASFAEQATDRLGVFPMHQRQIANVEATRSTNATARASEAYQRGLLTLDRLRNGRRQNIVVQHVNVGNGGKAVVAGAMQPRGAPTDVQGTG